jgi:hypothetical protein
MKENQNSIEELQDLSPILADLKKEAIQPIFKTPLFYFDTLQDKVFEKLEHKPEMVVTKTPTWVQRLQQWLWQPSMAWALSTMVMVVVAGTFWFQNRTQNASVTPVLALHDEVHQYITAHLDDFEEELLTEYHESQEPKDFKSQLTTEELEHYLNEVAD